MTSVDSVPGGEISPPVEGGRPLGTPPMSLEQSIAQSARQMRLARGLTLAELAAKVGISRQMLSKIENAQTSSSLGTIDALAKGLEVPVTSLFRAADNEAQAVYVKAGQAPETVRRGSNLGHNYRLLGALTGRNSNLEPLLVTLTEDSQVFPLFQHTGTEFVYVLEGKMEYQHQDRTYLLETGDSVLFDGEGVHGPANLIETPVRFLSIFAHQDKVLDSFSDSHPHVSAKRSE
ncbi:helix-turn-helix domain-containing protein [Gulosibacter molinativorax]|uniref:DNA-binding protein n=1 Tax=Gulosibacter molinativorax TaxID=256821 RepID=A0ABT7C576_9MICO|nr:XRE family transcriptional regulator [Gulosibacter molinativorax]MDJ1370346.1 DNA-binding protein [Gulosibacter molinativorax]